LLFLADADFNDLDSLMKDFFFTEGNAKGL